ncbi:hypothetical protein AMIS_59250 [Actinoplanes missouriensis 431]|uniref:Fibronectin type-III domain-containing protein n=1 Tax=Actinoplanes missouriensis (strain ATCC 14538 / DSM 43046 / CBS 188.64 / JCM 3121 / NBRC 102363 / NCIMB 12654 / NRRL B-3342 / UNCC 431) TaxID=512565 RepID=I0HDQ8_ACTM4|nr:choice-of-anchor L domain-containing protein [Actinoplanes missouriensis]BAL91145.1 hypothetical protein AMIS_59250 [Actinoplanes missouriensis 431]
MRTSTVFVVAASLLAFGSPAAAAPAPATGSVRVTIVTPSGVPAGVTLAGRTRQVAAKPPEGTSTVVTLTPAAGLYAVQTPGLIFDGVRYAGRASTPVVRATAGGKAAVTVTYAADGAARDLHATDVTATGVKLSWKAPAGARFVLRRTPGRVPVSLSSLGAGVRVKGTTAVDSGLKAGQQYTYSLFTFHKGRWAGPLTMTAGPASAADTAKYVANPATLLAGPADLVSAAPTGSGVRAVLRNGVATPVPGAAVVLPISDTLPGGFLGVVTAVAADGRTLSLRAGALIDAFDYYELDVPEFSAAAAAQSGPAPSASAKSVAPKALSASCGSASAGDEVVFSPDVKLGGHFSTKVDKYSFLGADVPTGASVDMGLTVTVSGPAGVKVSGNRKCKVGFSEAVKQLSVSPVPMALSYAAGAEISIGGAMEIANLGLTGTAGFEMKGSMSVKNGASFSGKRILDASPLAPKVTANGSVGLKVGGDVIVGPGAGTKEAGVIAGIGGGLYPVDAAFGPVFTAEDSRFNACLEAKLGMSIGLFLTVKVFLSKWSFSEKVTLDALKGSHSYAGSPYYLPKDCKTLAGGSKDSLLGDGVDKVEDTTVGAAEQWGHVDGFVPGKKTWVLSTGRMADALGDPGKFASTALGRDGDAELTEFAGHPTHDAASYQVKLVPAGDTLHVRYVFASEEYPEYVNSSYNDVMAVRVDGKNCALVPGTTQPVSVNTINAGENADHYVDNADGAAGYATSMDGLTKPLTCSVPVTPGKEVTVQIAVADSSDQVYDSAIALVDGGIWTD